MRCPCKTVPPDLHHYAILHTCAAIRFVLNDLFTTLRQEDRERLLHVGVGRYWLRWLSCLICQSCRSALTTCNLHGRRH